jgi:hypothetical protein
MQVGILIGIGQSLVSLLYIKKDNTMIGIVIVGINLIWKKDPQKVKIRKLSVTVTLTDPKEYKGGELEFDLRNEDPDKKPNIKNVYRNITKRLFGCIPFICMA